MGRSQSARKDSYCLLKNGVPEMFLMSSKEEGGFFFGMGVCCSKTHARGNSLDLVISLYMIVTGGVSSTEHSFTRTLLISPGTIGRRWRPVIVFTVSVEDPGFGGELWAVRVSVGGFQYTLIHR